jgi:hypothetical protein
MEQIDEVEQLVEMPYGTIARDPRGIVWVRTPSKDEYTHWRGTNGASAHSIRLLDEGPVDVLWHPDQEKIEPAPTVRVQIRTSGDQDSEIARRMAAVPRTGDYVPDQKGENRQVMDVYWSTGGQPTVVLRRSII